MIEENRKPCRRECNLHFEEWNNFLVLLQTCHFFVYAGILVMSYYIIKLKSKWILTKKISLVLLFWSHFVDQSILTKPLN
jgi:hypothetical protein